MADKYPDFETLARNEISGEAFAILARQARLAVAVVAPHGGGIEPGTSEIADVIAGETLSFYAFDGLKRSGNTDLHITSTRFDEPMCLSLLRRSDTVLTIHGEGSGELAAVFLGGRDRPFRGIVGEALQANGFDVRIHADPDLQGLERRNLCNRGRSHKGVQLEISLALRRQMFRSLTREGRKYPTPVFDSFAEAVTRVLQERTGELVRVAHATAVSGDHPKQ